jgi:probable F420-dependent oxidoreductase
MSGGRPGAASRRPFRFGLSTASEFAQVARRPEVHGYATLLVADHLGSLAPIPAAVAAAAATNRLRVGTFLLNNDFRHPGVLAQEVATADLLSEGRFELGMGAGYMKAEYDAVGLGFDPSPVRIDRLEEAALLFKRLLAGETVTHQGRFYRFADHRLSPLPPQGAWLPLLIGGDGDQLLSVAARLADTVGFTGFSPRKGGTEPTTTHFHRRRPGRADRLRPGGGGRALRRARAQRACPAGGGDR